MTKEYPKPDWAKGQVRRESGLMEDICEHGVGHPNATWLQKHDPEGKLGFSVHGCDGCCSPEMKKAIQAQSHLMARSTKKIPKKRHI